ncbi:hypothetical protein Uis4E_0249 [Bifidobacterium parmae]|uniref:Uncharacterized protein n=1 Tax=Bifidobacterium parmae TaxID=361854 RepID=A0A2N5J5X8_9BIFI|nr:hypothetical protein Uis4E_0249 [Bifidobacterium parmae]
MFDIDKVRAIMSRYPRIHPEDAMSRTNLSLFMTMVISS